MINTPSQVSQFPWFKENEVLSWGGYSQITVDDACQVSPTFGITRRNLKTLRALQF